MIRTVYTEFEIIWGRATHAFRLGPVSFHGPTHWRRVEAIGLRLSERTGADNDIVRLFAILHDCRREDEGRDSDHVRRSAAFARTLHGHVFQIEPERFALLEQAIT